MEVSPRRNMGQITPVYKGDMIVHILIPKLQTWMVPGQGSLRVEGLQQTVGAEYILCLVAHH